MSGEQAFSFFLGTSEATRAEAGAWASRTALKIRCKLSSEYLETLIATAGDFGPRGILGYSEDSDLGDGEEPEGTTEGAKGKRSRQKRLRPRTEIFLKMIFSKTLFQTS